MPKLLILGAVAVMAVAFAVPASADAPKRFVLVDDFSFQSGLLTAACGTPVFRSVSGPVLVILRTAADGSVQETDAFQNWALTISAPEFGTAISWKFGPAFYDYPEGAEIGAPAFVTVVGLDSKVPGLHAEGGRTVLQGEVIDFTPEGIPVADTFATLSEVGNQVDNPVLVEAICAALTG